MFEKQVSIVYEQTFNGPRYQIIQTNQSFINLLKNKKEIVIQAQLNEKVQFFSQDETFKFVHINLPTTVLVTDVQGNIKKQTNSYLSIEKCKADTSKIYFELKFQTISEKDIIANQTLQQLVKQKGIQIQTILNLYKISKKQFINFAELAKFLIVGDQILITQDKLFNSVFSKIVSKLTENGNLFQTFNIQTLQQILQIKYPVEILRLTLNRFNLLSQDQITYALTKQSIIRFVLSELAEIKKQYIKSEFDKLLNESLKIYLPANVQIPKEIPQVAESFLFIKQKGHVKNYNIFQLPSTLKELIDTISKIKLRYSYQEVKGLFRHLFNQKNFQEALLKNFRKFNKDYELKSSNLF